MFQTCVTYGLRFCLRFWGGVLRFCLRFPIKCEQFWYLPRFPDMLVAAAGSNRLFLKCPPLLVAVFAPLCLCFAYVFYSLSGGVLFLESGHPHINFQRRAAWPPSTIQALLNVLWRLGYINQIKKNQQKITNANKNNMKWIWKRVCWTWAIPGLRFCLRFWWGVLRFSLRFLIKCA